MTIINPGILTKLWRSPPRNIAAMMSDRPEIMPNNDARSKLTPDFLIDG